MTVHLIDPEQVFTITREKFFLTHVLIIYLQKCIFVLMGGNYSAFGIVCVCPGFWINGKDWVIDCVVTGFWEMNLDYDHHMDVAILKFW